MGKSAAVTDPAKLLYGASMASCIMPLWFESGMSRWNPPGILRIRSMTL